MTQQPHPTELPMIWPVYVAAFALFTPGALMAARQHAMAQNPQTPPQSHKDKTP